MFPAFMCTISTVASAIGRLTAAEKPGQQQGTGHPYHEAFTLWLIHAI